MTAAASLLTRSHLAALLEDNGLRPVKGLGQHFLADPNTAQRIVRLAGVEAGDQVVEIGAGLGSLTLALAGAGARVTAVEVDRHLVPVLRSVVEPAGVRVVEADALMLDWTALLSGGAGPGSAWKLVANLPYNVATPLVVRILEQAPAVTTMLVMVQAEVGQRLAAPPGSRAYGGVSVKVAYWAKAQVVGHVGASVFLPRPSVTSVLVALSRRAEPAVDPAEVAYDRLVEVVRAGFGHRRKMLRGALAGLVDEGAFAAAGVDPTARAEELDVARWGRLAARPAGMG